MSAPIPAELSLVRRPALDWGSASVLEQRNTSGTFHSGHDDPLLQIPSRAGAR